MLSTVSKEVIKPCRLCETKWIPGFEKAHQQLLSTKHGNHEIQAHYFCLLFSSGLSQRGDESEGLQGFLANDIRRELRRGARLKCVYCKKKGATVGCARPQCKKSYHLPCGMTNYSLQQYYDQFKSYCAGHRPVQKVKNLKTLERKDVCSICQERASVPPSPSSLWSPCCGGTFHLACLQTTASLTMGSSNFRCPLCNDVQKFVPEMKQFGIYIPSKYGLLEQGIQSRSLHNAGKIQCQAHFCLCDKQSQDHRLYNDENSIWEIIGCHVCGKKGIHARCGGLDEYVDPQWYCYTCRREEQLSPSVEKCPERSVVEIWGTAISKKPVEEKIVSTSNNKFVSNGIASLQKSHPEVTIEPTTFQPMDVDSSKVFGSVTTSSDLMSITLEEIIVKGLDEKLRETNYKSKIFTNFKPNATTPAAQPVTKPIVMTSQSLQSGQPCLPQPNLPTQQKSVFSVPAAKVDNKSRHKSQDSSNSPGDSDYESAQETIPFKIRKTSESEPVPTKVTSEGWNNAAISTVIIRKPGLTNGLNRDMKLHLNQSDFIDQKIKNSINEFFRESNEQKLGGN